MPTLSEILRDPNYINANEATKRAIFERHAPLDQNYTGANEATQFAIRQRFGVEGFGAPVVPPPEKESAFRQIADVPLGIAKGAVQGVRMIADAFGAGSDTSKTIKSAETYLADLMSAQAKNDQQEIARIMKDAEDKGVLDQVKAGIKAFTVAPVDTLSSALGTAAPVIAGALGAKILGAGALVSTGVSALTGAGMGAGVVKGSIYEETKNALKEAGASEQDAEARAKLAQEYGGKNLDQILLGTVLGGAAAVGPLEKGGAAILARRILGKTGTEATETVAGQAAKGAVRRRLEAGALEAVPEAIQAGQEQVAQNIALQREGFDVPTFRGAVSAATMEALAGAGLGATVGGGKPAAPEAQPVTPETITPAAQPPVAEVPPVAPAPEVAPTAPETPVTPVAETPVTPTVETPVAEAPPTILSTPAAPVAETPPVETTPPTGEVPPAPETEVTSTATAEAQPEGRPGYDTQVEIDAKVLQKAFERDNQEPLVNKPEKLEAWRTGTAKTNTITSPIEVGFKDNGKFGINDGRHRIALAAERGETVKVMVDKKDVDRLKALQSTVAPAVPPQTLQEFQERMPIIFDSAEVRAANNEGNFAKLTKALQRSSNPAIRRIGQLGGGVVSKITLKKPGRLGGNTAGIYTYDDDAIQMIPSYSGDEHTNAHEVLHALISKSQRNPTERQKPIVQKIDKLYEHVKRELKKKGITVREAYGLKNAREFTAEAMTNPKFQYELMQIPYPGRKTAWTQFVQLVSDLLGIQNTNALTEVMNLVDRLAQTKQPRKTVTDKGLVDESIVQPEPTPPKGVAGVKAAAQKALQKQPMPEKGLGHVSPELKNLAQPIFFAQNKTILDRIDGMKDRFWQRVAQKTADQFRTIKEYSPVGYMQARLSKSVDGGLEGLLFHGQVFDDGGALNIKAKTKGMVDILRPLGNELDSYLMWVALNRESRLPEAKRSKIPNMDQLVARRDEFSAGELNGQPRVEVYEDVLKQMNQLNKSVLDIALAKGLIDQKAYDKFSGDLYYIPFYKKMEEDGDIAGAQTASGLTSQYFSKELKGGDKPFGDLMENVVRNWSHILSASMKNAAAKTTLDDAVELGAAVPNLKVGLEWKDGQVYSIKSGKPVEAKFDENGKLLYEAGELRPDLTKQDAGMAKVMVDGQPMYFKVTDDLLMDSISSIGYLGPKSAFLDVARNFKNMLQYGVTASPIFKVNNLIRDSVAAMAVSDLKKNPVANVLEGVSLSKKDSPTYISALAGGAIFNFGSAYEGDQAKLIKRLLDQGVPGYSILDTKEKITKGLKGAWDAYQHLGDRSEAANRLSLYQQLRDKGMTHLQASFMARDLLDFSMQGSWPAFRLVTQVVPFMNARIQGLYKLGRDGIIPTTRVLYNATTGKEIDANDKIRAAQFATITTAVMLASALLYLSFKDDEDFKKRDAWDRDNFWWIKLPGMDVALRVPKPFEVGAFGTLVERSLEQILDQGAEGKQFGESLARTLWDTFALNPTPQMFKPLVDIYANKDSFSGAPIESAGLERLSKQERATDQTSPLGIALGGITSIFPEKFQLSPVQMDYILKGYFGWLGAMASVTSTYAVMPFKEGEYPDARWLDRASLGLARELPAPQSAYVTQFYNASKEISQAYADMRHYREMGDAEKVQEILEEKGDKIALAKFYDKTAKNIANVRKQIQLITNDKTMDGAEKREAIERMKLIMSDLAKQAEEVRKSMK